MCPTTDYGGYHPPQRLKTTAFFLRLSLSSPSDADLLPDSLTLLLLPRLNAAPLHLNGSFIAPDSPAFLSLHRLPTANSASVVFAAGDRLRAADGLSFEVHIADNRLLKGVFRRRGGDWTVECKSAGEVAGVDVREAEVSVAVEKGGVMREKVAVRRCRRRRGFRMGLEDIPEERDDDDECWCCECDCEEEEEERENGEDEYGETMESVGWAVDVGFWVMCLGVGFLVSRASSRKFRRATLFS